MFCRYGPGDYPMAISLVARGLIDLKPLVTHRFKFEEAVKAFGVTQQGKDEEGKVSIPSHVEMFWRTWSLMEFESYGMGYSRQSSVLSMDRNKQIQLLTP